MEICVLLMVAYGLYQEQKGRGRSFPAFHPRCAGKCDPQSRDLIQLISGYNFAVKPATNQPSSSCWMDTWDMAEKYLKWFMKMFLLLGFESDTFSVDSDRFTNSATPPLKTTLKTIYYMPLKKIERFKIYKTVKLSLFVLKLQTKFINFRFFYENNRR